MKTLFMETTKIDPARTVAEIQKILMECGALSILTEMEHGKISAVSFKYQVGDRAIPFRLPCRWQNIESLLAKRGRFTQWNPAHRREELKAKAERVAWRQILRWVEAQLALVDTSMVKVEEVFFPYIQAPGGYTIYELHEKDKFLQLAAGK